MTDQTSAAGAQQDLAQPRRVHLLAGATSFVLTVDANGAQLLHWGPALARSTDLDALAAASVPAVAHSAPDDPVRRPALPMPSDGWRMRPVLSGCRADGTAFSPLLAVGSVAVTAAPDGLPTAVSLEAGDADAGVTVSTTWRLDRTGVLLVDQRVRNDGESTYLLGGLLTVLPLPDGARELLDLTGRWCRERDPQRHQLGMGAWVREGRHGRTGHDAPTLLVAGTPGFGFGSGQVWAVHVGWSGDSVYAAERSPSGHAQLSAGELLLPGEVRLGPGESYAAPTVYAVYSGEGLDGMSAQLHEFVRSRPSHPRTPRPVTLNTWEAVYFDHSLGKLTALADAAAAVGVERFVLDDGWFGGRRWDGAGLGDWVVSQDAWPSGLGPLVDHVTALGMGFGLWVEPEMVNPDSDLYRAHPEWVLQVPGRLPVTWRRQLVLDLAHPGAFEHVLGQLDAVLSEYAISYIKWDHNRDLVDPGHLGVPGVRAQTLAAYRLVDELRARHPGVEFESCASGGGRVDLGILERTERVWTSDTIDPLERQHIQRWTGLLVPPELMGSHIGAAQAHLTHRHAGLGFRVATALFGHLGIEADLTVVDDAERQGITQAVSAYRELRHVLHTGRVVRVDHPDPSAIVHGVVGPDCAVFSYVQLTSSPTEVPPPVLLCGLDEAAAYRVRALPIAGGPTSLQRAAPPWMWGVDGVVMGGDVLQRVGLHMPVLDPEQALVLRLDRLE